MDVLVGVAPSQVASASLFPNPFNGSSNLQFTLKAASDVTVEAFDLSGKRLARLLAGALPAGDHTLPIRTGEGGLPNGVYLINLDGTALLTHFTEENSPLPDNEVVALAIDHSTGEVFFGTSKGTVSYMGDAIDGRPDASELYVFPNPVAWDHDGIIMIKGMPQNASIKIANVAGQVVRELESFGGEVAWDGLDAFGKRANPGIYLAMVADPDGKGSGIVKFAILERPQ